MAHRWRTPSIAVPRTVTRSAPPSVGLPDPASLGIPWASAGQWSAAHKALAFVKCRQEDRLRPVSHSATATGVAIRAFHDLAAELALSSCRFCPAPCCAAAAPWYDFTDLLMIHFGGMPTPPGQPIIDYGDRCRYLGPAGCRLPRPQRPWICAWYTCPVQRAALSRIPATAREYANLAAQIQRRRRQLEQSFIEITAGRAMAPPELFL
ncbi:MAG: hypothetical protein ABIL58_02555 [Pseudomonadota bacterium]